MSGSRIVTKAIIFTAQAQQHHTQVKVKNVMKWINSGYEVKVQITGSADRQKLMDSIYKELEGSVRSVAKIQAKQMKPDKIKFTIKPNADMSSREQADSDKEIE